MSRKKAWFWIIVAGLAGAAIGYFLSWFLDDHQRPVLARFSPATLAAPLAPAPIQWDEVSITDTPDGRARQFVGVCAIPYDEQPAFMSKFCRAIDEYLRSQGVTNTGGTSFDGEPADDEAAKAKIRRAYFINRYKMSVADRTFAAWSGEVQCWGIGTENSLTIIVSIHHY